MPLPTPPTKVWTPRQHLAVGLQFGDLEIRSVLGVGGSAVTYRAVNVRTNHEAALKEYFPRRWAVRRSDGTVTAATAGFAPLFRAGLDRFITEAQILARFRAPGIVRVDRVFASMGTGYMLLAYVGGPTLAQWLELRRSPPSQAELDGFISSITSTLAMIHAAGILHCDIGPRNIMLADNGLPILIDFGSARFSMAQQSPEPAVLVTPNYSPQELYNSSGSQRGPWTDIYATAAVLHALLMGIPPPAAPERALGVQYVRLSADPRLQGYRSSFLSAVDWGLEFLPGRRPQSITQWLSAIHTPKSQSPTGLRV
ncbi:MAG: serine/threonine-protein kinase [Hyphomicrobiaceae bacterium]